MSMQKKYFYIIIGSMYFKESESYLRDFYIKNNTSVSNNVFERKLFNGFKTVIGEDGFVFLSAPTVGWWPFNCKRIKMKGIKSFGNYCAVNYITTYIGSICSKTKALKKALYNVINSLDLKTYIPCLIINEMHLPYLNLTKCIKKIDKDSVVVQLVPDLPEYNNRSKKKIYNFFKKINCNKIEKIRSKYVDKYILFSKPMAAKLNLSENEYIVNYGITPNWEPQYTKKFNDGKKHVVFLGKVDKRNGIDLIIYAAKKFQERKDIVFDIFGISASEGFTLDSSIKNLNIKFHGFINPTSVSDILRSSDVLLSPRFPFEEYTQYSFPSKIFEYLSSYKPVVTFKLNCYPSELDEILLYPESLEGSSFCKSIIDALDFSVDVGKTEAFLSKYTEMAVAKKIINFVERKRDD